MEEKWKQSFKDKLSDYQRPEPQLPWSDVESALKAAGSAKRAAVLPWAVRILSAAAAAGLVFFLIRVTDKENERDDRYAAHAENPVAVDLQTDILNDIDENLIEEEPYDAKIDLDGRKHADYRADAVSDFQPEEMPVPETVLPQDSVSVPEKAADEPVRPKSAEEDVKPSRDPSRDYFREAVRKRRTQRLTAAVYASSASAGRPSAGAASGSQADPVIGEEAVGLPGNRLFRQSRSEIQLSEKHDQPVRFGISLRYSLTDRLSLESGLSYSLLKSKFTYSYRLADYETVQRLNYIGIPFQASCRLWEAGNFRLYVSAGGMAEKMIQGNATTSVSGKSISTVSVDIKPLQFSVNGAAGLEYGLGSRIGLFVEPGVSYYFDNSADVKNFYQEKPLSFNLNIGLRINLLSSSNSR